VQQFFDEDYPIGGRYYWKSANLKRLGDEVIDRLIRLNDAAPSAHSTLDIWFQGGAMSRVDAKATAFGDRRAPIMIGIEANWHDEAEDEANMAWARRCYEALGPFSDGSIYVNFPGLLEEGEPLLRASYGAGYERLTELKAVYDPSNLFRLNQNIKPRTSHVV
jgi:hypothetical protein